MNLIVTAPRSPTRSHGFRWSHEVDNPSLLPNENTIEAIQELPILTSIHAEECLGAMMKLCEDRRSIQRDLRFLGEKRVILHYNCRWLKSSSIFTTA